MIVDDEVWSKNIIPNNKFDRLLMWILIEVNDLTFENSKNRYVTSIVEIIFQFANEKSFTS